MKKVTLSSRHGHYARQSTFQTQVFPLLAVLGLRICRKEGLPLSTQPGPVCPSDKVSIPRKPLVKVQRYDGLHAFLFTGPALVASIAYMDPGNFATNIQAGSQYGYSLLWVVLSANMLAMLFQALSAKFGLVTRQDLAEACRRHFPMPIVYLMWCISEFAAMATDVAEFLGGAIAFSLLCNIPLVAGMVITGVVTYAILLTERQRSDLIQIIIGAFVAGIALCYVIELFFSNVSWMSTARGFLQPAIRSPQELGLAVGIVGATVMPHAIYLHSGLAKQRAMSAATPDIKKLVRLSNREVIFALSLAGLVNIAIVVVAAAAFHTGHSDVVQIETAYRTLTPLLGKAAAAVFLVSLLASGVSSSVVGTIAGQVIMQGFVGFRIPIWFRRLATMAPAFIVVLMGVNTTDALIYSQVALSLCLPVPIISLVVLTSRSSVMGKFKNTLMINFTAILGGAIIIVLNLILVLQVLGVNIPGLS